MVQRHTIQASPLRSQAADRPASPSYFVVMCRYPNQRKSEAVVDPEQTRGRIIDLIARGEFENIEFIHEIVVGEPVRNVTAELMVAAQAEFVESAWVDRDPQTMRRLAGVA